VLFITIHLRQAKIRKANFGNNSYKWTFNFEDLKTAA